MHRARPVSAYDVGRVARRRRGTDHFRHGRRPHNPPVFGPDDSSTYVIFARPAGATAAAAFPLFAREADITAPVAAYLAAASPLGSLTLTNGGLNLPGAAGAFAGSARPSALTAAGDLRLVFKGKIPNVATGVVQNLIAAVGAGVPPVDQMFAWRFAADGKMQLIVSSNGGVGTTAGLTALAMPANVWMDATWRASDGRVQFRQSTDRGATWVQVSTDKTANVGTLYASTQELTVGARASGFEYATGLVEGVEVWRNGVLVASRRSSGRSPASRSPTRRGTRGRHAGRRRSPADRGRH